MIIAATNPIMNTIFRIFLAIRIPSLDPFPDFILDLCFFFLSSSQNLFRSFSGFLYSMICPGWQFRSRHKWQITSQVTFSFRVNFATVLEWIPLFFSHCLFTFFCSMKTHNFEKSMYPFCP